MGSQTSRQLSPATIRPAVPSTTPTTAEQSAEETFTMSNSDLELPNEIIHQICSHLIEHHEVPISKAPFPIKRKSLRPHERRDLCRMRLASKAFDYGVACELYRSVSCGIAVRDYNGLFTLAEGQSASCVRELKLVSCFWFLESDKIQSAAALASVLPLKISKFTALRHLVLDEFGFNSLLGTVHKRADAMGHWDLWVSLFHSVDMTMLNHLTLGSARLTSELARDLEGLEKDGITNSMLLKNLERIRRVTLRVGGRFDDGSWTDFHSRVPNLQVLEIIGGPGDEGIALNFPLTKKPVSTLRVYNAKFSEDNLCSLLGTSMSILTELVLENVELVRGSSIHVYEFIRRNCTQLTTLHLGLQDTNNHRDRILMLSEHKEDVGVCQAGHARYLAAYCKVFETVDNNRVNAGLEARYHRIMTPMQYKLHEMKCAYHAAVAAKAKAA